MCVHSESVCACANYYVTRRKNEANLPKLIWRCAKDIMGYEKIPLGVVCKPQLHLCKNKPVTYYYAY